jgi:hypothetical protein
MKYACALVTPVAACVAVIGSAAPVAAHGAPGEYGSVQFR